MTLLRPTLALALLAPLLASAGCGGGSLTPTDIPAQPVKGKVVSADGKPLAGGTLRFTLTTNKDKYGEAEANAAVQPDGTFEPRQVGDKAGLVPGKWKVVVDPTYVKDSKTLRVSVPAKYTRLATTDLTIDVPDGGVTDVTLTLK
jgi:hypothetical protein